MASIYQIAKEVGVSPSTVARALRGKGYVSKENLEKIRAVAERLNYAPSYVARSLKSKRTGKVLFCIPDIYNPFYFGMIKGASDVLDAQGYLVILAHTGGEKAREMQMLQNLMEGYGDGMIFVSFDFNEENTRRISETGCPVVLTNHYAGEDDQFDCVYIDTHQGVYMATRHLLRQGFSHIGYIGGDLARQTGRERHAGFVKAMREANAPMDDACILESDFTLSGGEAAAQAMLRAEARPDALVVANDLMAVGAMQVLQAQGLRVPEDVAIIGMDNTLLSSCVTPKLSSIGMREGEIGAQAAKLLLERIIDGRQEKRVIRLEPMLYLRESSERKA